MSYRTLTKDRELVIPETGMVKDLEMLSRDTSSFPLVTQEQLKNIADYKWHSDANRRSAGKNLGCALIGAERGWPAQTDERFTRFLEDYDSDRVEKSISDAEAFHPQVKLFGASTDDVAPILIKGENHIWQGQRLDELQALTREDQLVPAKVMKRVYGIEHSGSGFKNGYALFWPYEAYEARKKTLFSEQVDVMKRDGRKMVSLAKSGAKLVKDTVSSVANATANITVAVASSVAQVAGSAIDRMSEMQFERQDVQLSDPVLTGIIVGSVPTDRRVFFIEIGRWV